jgi:hypothetical protein
MWCWDPATALGYCYQGYAQRNAAEQAAFLGDDD